MRVTILILSFIILAGLVVGGLIWYLDNITMM
jgi:hypothetical protein